ncbi:MAG: DUF1013 domain-containing protein [Reyranellaceae bacterium]
MSTPLMPKATAVWLVDNTTLSFRQIAEFCGMHELEVQAIADGEVASGIVGADPIASGQLTREEIERGEADPSVNLRLAKNDRPQPVSRPKGPRYTPVAKRQDRPDAIAWLLKNHPELSDAQIAKLIGTTKATINAVRDRTHWNAQNLKPRDPATLGLCSMADLHAAIDRARRKAARNGQSIAGVELPTVDPSEADQPDLEEPDAVEAQGEDDAGPDAGMSEVDPAQADQPDVDMPVEHEKE